ncbi:F-box only protein 4 [Salminus brasiliensis]|uniref:F-box only protein 4 n=1 Tax=Salminus brasiliensis TaxID=930266 RepID=UPI003B830E31
MMRSALLRSLRSVRETLLSDHRARHTHLPQRRAEEEEEEEEEEGSSSSLDHLPVDVQFLIMTYLPPEDLCRLGGCSRYWRSMVQEPLLWRYFFMRDMASWTSVDHASMPREEFLSTAAVTDRWELRRLDYMSEYLRCSPVCRGQYGQQRPALEAVAYFLQNLVAGAEPRFAMLGPGLEQLDVSLMTTMMYSPHILPVAGIPQRQIGGIGSGISFLFNGRNKFNIITLYSTNSSERERARLEQQSVRSKLFVQEGEAEGRSVYSVAPQVQEVCQAVNGFIFVSNAETDRGRMEEYSQLRAVLQPIWGPASRPLLVLSCVSREGADRTPSVTVAHQLQLHLLTNPWMVQDAVSESLAGLLDGLCWLLKQSGVRL